MIDFPLSPIDNQEVCEAYLQAKNKLKEAAQSFKYLELALQDKFMAITKTDRQLLEESVTTICSASWGLKIQGVKIKQARAKSRIMTACDTELIDKETL